MQPEVNLQAILITNILGVVLLGVLFAGNLWRFREKTPENNSVMVFMLFAFSNCVTESISYYIDGYPGGFFRVINYVSNSWLYISTMLTSLCWIRFLFIHLTGSFPRLHQSILTVIIGSASFLLLINLFEPLVFSVDENNVYSREMFFWLYLLVNYGILIDSLIVYCRCRWRRSPLKSFALWAYIIPVAICAVIQCFFYGVSVISASYSIAIAGILSTLQNESIFKDRLTGLFNRTYLDYLLKKIAHTPNAHITGVMIDLNDFKQINDHYGHEAGDVVLRNTAHILEESIGDLGTAIRYAGDEFILLLNSQMDAVVQMAIGDIKKNMEEFNVKNPVRYSLSASFGYCKLNLKEQSVDEFLNEIDKRMYEDKKSFYAAHPESEGRRSPRF